jgi:hypothetical protein
MLSYFACREMSTIVLFVAIILFKHVFNCFSVNYNSFYLNNNILIVNDGIGRKFCVGLCGFVWSKGWKNRLFGSNCPLVF